MQEPTKSDHLPTTTLEPDLSATFYACMREELLKRLELREHTLALSVTALAALLGFGASSHGFKSYILLMIAPLSLGSAVLVLEHSAKIGFIAEYLDQECRRYARRIRRPHWRPWELSDQLRLARLSEYKGRTLGEVMLLLLPLLICLFLAFPVTWTWPSKEAFTWLIGVAIAVGIIFLLVRHLYWHSTIHRYSEPGGDDPSVLGPPGQ